MDLLVMFKSLETIDRRRNYRLASEELLIDQSTLNKRIKRLEAYYNAELVIRSGQSVNVTTAGKTILYKYREIEEVLRNAENEILSIDNYLIGTTTDIMLNSTISDYVNNNIHVSNDFLQLIKDFNSGLYREIILESRFDKQIDYKQKELFTTIQIGVLGNLNIPDEITVEELFSTYKLLGNSNDPYSQILAFQIKEEFGVTYEYTAYSCMQEVLEKVINTEGALCIVPSVLVLPERLKAKMKSVKITGLSLNRRIYRYKR